MATSDFYSKESPAGSFRKRKARFTFSEVHIMLDEVKKHRHILVGRPHQSVPGDLRKRTWTRVTAAINEIGEYKREAFEVVKKWSDLKCDTRRKLLAMRADNTPEHKMAARVARDLTTTERIVHDILQMDHALWEDGAPLYDDDEEDWISPMEEEEEGDEEDEDEDEWTPQRPRLQPSTTFAVRKRKFRRLCDDPAAGAAAAYAKAPSPDHHHHQQQKRHHQQQQPQQQQQPHRQPPPPAPSSAAPLPLPPLSSSSSAASSSSSSSFSAVLPEPPGPAPQDARGSLLQSAALSLQEQHTGNVLLETVSRSLELLAESLQQLAESQAVFARQSLQLQRETVDALRNFAAGAVALMHDRLNGKPPAPL